MSSDEASIPSTMLKVKVDRSETLRLHEQVAAELRRAIAEGEARPGERLPPARPAPHAPRRDVDVEALIKEARRRQRRRQALIATGVLAVAAAVAIAVKGLTGGGAESRRAAARPGAGARASVTTPFAVGAATSP